MRRLVIVLLAGLLVVGGASPALAWANGPDGPDSYGTHDWVLDQALQAVGEKASWVNVRVALRATDDPDTVEGIDHASGTWWHVYDEWGETYGGAPEAAATWFRRTKRRLASGNERGASRALGILAHIVGDIANPMHTDSRDREDSIHSPYESDVDERLEGYRFDYDGEGSAKPFARTLTVARRAHRYYFDLIRAYDRNGYNDKVDGITRRQLNRGSNAVADLITSLR